jgi:hypothetical protein
MFQLELARRLEKVDDVEWVKLEFKIPCRTIPQYYELFCKDSKVKNPAIYVDIVVKSTDNDFVAIELKCLTASLVFKSYNILGKAFPNVEVLTTMSAANNNCYACWQDVFRIETILENYSPSFIGGFSVIITNDDCYVNGPKQSNCAYAPFAISSGQHTIPKIINDEKKFQNKICERTPRHGEHKIQRCYQLGRDDWP